MHIIYLSSEYLHYNFNHCFKSLAIFEKTNPPSIVIHYHYDDVIQVIILVSLDIVLCLTWYWRAWAVCLTWYRRAWAVCLTWYWWTRAVDVWFFLILADQSIRRFIFWYWRVRVVEVFLKPCLILIVPQFFSCHYASVYYCSFLKPSWFDPVKQTKCPVKFKIILSNKSTKRTLQKLYFGILWLKLPHNYFVVHCLDLWKF